VTAEDMDRLDEALRCTIKKLWPIEGKKMHALLIPPNDGRCLTPSLRHTMCIQLRRRRRYVYV